MPQPCSYPALSDRALVQGARLRDIGADLVAAVEAETATPQAVLEAARAAHDCAMSLMLDAAAYAVRGEVAPPPAPVLDATLLDRQRDFSLRTFGPGQRTAGVLAHIRKELAEVERDPADVSEWADVMILAVDGALRAGHAPAEVLAAYRAKLERNFARTWPDWRAVPADAPIEHDRSADPLPSVYQAAPGLEAGFADRAARVSPEVCDAGALVLSVTHEDGEVQT